MPHFPVDARLTKTTKLLLLDSLLQEFSENNFNDISNKSCPVFVSLASTGKCGMHAFLWLLLLHNLLIPVTAQGQCSLEEKSVGDCEGGQSGSRMLRTALILGGSGETGKQLLKQLAADPSYNKVISVGRRKVDLPSNPGMGKVVQEEVIFDNLSEYSSVFPRVDSAFICLGTTRAKAGAEGFVKVDYDYVVEASKLLHNSGCPDLHLVSSQGASASSPFLYPSTKGKAEEAVKALGFPRLTIYRPGLLICPRSEQRLVEGAMQWLAQKADQSSRGSVPTSVVARAMLRSSLKKEGEGGILEHKDIVTLGKE